MFTSLPTVTTPGETADFFTVLNTVCRVFPTLGGCFGLNVAVVKTCKKCGRTITCAESRQVSITFCSDYDEKNGDNYKIHDDTMFCTVCSMQTGLVSECSTTVKIEDAADAFFVRFDRGPTVRRSTKLVSFPQSIMVGNRRYMRSLLIRHHRGGCGHYTTLVSETNGGVFMVDDNATHVSSIKSTTDDYGALYVGVGPTRPRPPLKSLAFSVEYSDQITPDVDEVQIHEVRISAMQKATITVSSDTSTVSELSIPSLPSPDAKLPTKKGLGTKKAIKNPPPVLQSPAHNAISNSAIQVKEDTSPPPSPDAKPPTSQTKDRGTKKAIKPEPPVNTPPSFSQTPNASKTSQAQKVIPNSVIQVEGSPTPSDGDFAVLVPGSKTAIAGNRQGGTITFKSDATPEFLDQMNFRQKIWSYVGKWRRLATTP